MCDCYRKAFTYVSAQKLFAGDRRPILCENLAETDPPQSNANFQSIFAHSASAVTPSEKSSIDTNTKYTTSFPMRIR